MKGFGLGFDKDHLIRIEMPGPNGYDAFKNTISQYDFVESGVSSEQAPGFIETFGLQLPAGCDG